MFLQNYQFMRPKNTQNYLKSQFFEKYLCQHKILLILILFVKIIYWRPRVEYMYTPLVKLLAQFVISHIK